jgi:hypothetical protein
MEAAPVFIWFIGMFIGMIVVRHRAGVGQGRIKILGRDGFGFFWFWRMVFALMFWPVTLIIWLARGCPEPRIVFNERAEERRRSMQSQ